MASINRQNIAEHLVEYELELVGKSVKDVIHTKWRELEMDEETFNKLKKYSISLIKKTFKCNKTKAENTFNWWWLNFGLCLKKN